jgi:16S rRNA (guanine966-N2)-methyltransferase
MRITGGIHKNRKIVTQTKTNLKVSYRPTAERTRLAVINILLNAKYIPENFITDAIVADVFCGCGSFGLELISRGAAKVFFIDQSPEQLEVVKQNLQTINEFPKSIMIRCDATMLPRCTKPCKIVYIDPPYKTVGITEKVLAELIKSEWLAPHNVIIIELDRGAKVELPENYELIDTRTYGKTKLLICTYHNVDIDN